MRMMLLKAPKQSSFHHRKIKKAGETMNDETSETQAISCESLTKADMARTEVTMCFNLSSLSEATGMIPTPPLDDADVEGYEALFYRPQQEADNARKADSPQEQQARSGYTH